MSYYSKEVQQMGLAKESVRGTAESAPSKWHPTRGNAEFTYALQHLQDEGIRGTKSKFAPIAGVKVGEAKIPLYLDAQTAGEYFYSLLGTKAAAQQGGSAAYLHTFTHAAGLQNAAYTFFVDRSLGVLKYNNGVVKKISLKGGVDNLIEMDVDALFKTEASGSIGSPSYPTQRFLSFQNVDFKIAGSSNTDVKEWAINIDNGSIPFRVLNASADVQDILTPGKLMIDGSFLIYFQNTTERDKFIANTAVKIEMVATGSTIASTYKYTVDVIIYEAHYKAFPYGEDQGLLAAKATFDGFYSSSDSKAIQVEVTNTETAY